MKIILTYILLCLMFTQDTLILINDKVITKNDFIKRAEYTIRPNYCNSKSNLDKKIILNSLIAEKLYAIENSESEIDDYKVLNSIKGIEQQTMRKVMLEDYVNHNLKINNKIITKLYNNAQYDYETNFIVIQDNITTPINQTFEQISKQFNVKPSSKVITFFTCSNNLIFNSFYSEGQIKKGDLVGPIKISDNEFILIQVLKKKKHIIIDNNSQRDQFTKIREFYIEKESASLRENFILDIMRGKEIEFNKNTFFNLADYYYDSKSTNKINPQDELFKLNNISWDIEDIMNINDSHPLVFRDSYNTKNEFYNQFKLALVDLVKNHFITNKAIAENYQNHPAVIKEVEIWTDYALAMDKKNKIINSNQNSKNYINEYDLIKNILTKESELLFNQYSEKIIIDTDILNQIELTHIDMMVININQPYQLTVPPFPKLTIKNNLNYGIKKPI